MRTLVAVLAIFVSACAPMISVGPNSPFDSSRNLLAGARIKRLQAVSTFGGRRAVAQPALLADAQGDVDAAYHQMLAGCQTTMATYENRGFYLGIAAASISILGALAGGVIVPYLAAAANPNMGAIAAIGGFSGVANTAQI